MEIEEKARRMDIEEKVRRMEVEEKARRMELEEKARCVLREGETTSRNFSLGKKIKLSTTRI
jgi:hypothetical protein